MLRTLTISVVAAAFGVGWLLVSPEQPISARQPVVAQRSVALAHRYHGIQFATHWPSGLVTFERNGQQCKLFTNGCVQYLNKAQQMEE